MAGMADCYSLFASFCPNAALSLKKDRTALSECNVSRKGPIFTDKTKGVTEQAEALAGLHRTAFVKYRTVKEDAKKLERMKLMALYVNERLGYPASETMNKFLNNFVTNSEQSMIANKFKKMQKRMTSPHVEMCKHA